MKQISTLFILAISISACGKAPVLELGQFEPYVQKFEQESEVVGAPVKVTDLKVQFGEMKDERENGVCEVFEDETPTITINKEAWDTMTDADREALMFHELGHCVLRRNHVTEVSADGTPVSLMNPYRIQTEIFVENQDYYIHELFDHQQDF
jgi:hypothetical protein